MGDGTLGGMVYERWYIRRDVYGRWYIRRYGL